MPHLLPTVTEAGWGGPRVSVVRTHTVPTHEEAANKVSLSPRSWKDQKAFAGEDMVLTAGCRGSLHSGQGHWAAALAAVPESGWPRTPLSCQ